MCGALIGGSKVPKLEAQPAPPPLPESPDEDEAARKKRRRARQRVLDEMRLNQQGVATSALGVVGPASVQQAKLG